MNLKLIHSIEKMGNVKIQIEDEDLYVDGCLDLNGCTNLTELPENLYVEHWLDLECCTGLTELPYNLHVRLSLYLNGCTGLTELPDNLYVDGSLYLIGCTGLTRLPENLHVGGRLNLSDCNNLKSNEHYLISKDIGSRFAKTVYKISTDIIKCGCFTGTLDNFEERVHDEYSSGKYREQYDEYIKLCRNYQVNNN